MSTTEFGDAVEQAVDRSAAPAAARVLLARIAEEAPAAADRITSDPALTAAVVAVAAASTSLARQIGADPETSAAVLADLGRREDPAGLDTTEAIVGWKQREYLRIAARDLTGLDPLEAVGANLAELGRDVLRASVTAAGVSGLAVIGMGKLGGRELNYASDLDVMFVGGDNTAARAVLGIARESFRVDPDLRPEGRNGPLTRSLESFEAYWDRWANTWEFQALLKARPVAGDADLGRRWCDAATTRLWQRPFGADELREVRSMKARAEAEVAKKGLTDRELKRGRGGIRDIEFAVQLLQLVHGRADEDLRSPTTLEALAALAHHGYVSPSAAEALAEAYRFLRTVEHRLQLVDEAQVHAVPADANARTRLARVMGYRDDPRAGADTTALAQFDAALRTHQAIVRGIHERLFFRPLLEAFSVDGTDGAALGQRAVEDRLSAFGFVDAERTRQALTELTRGLTRSSRMMQQLLPLLLGWLSESPDPDLGLLGLRALAYGQQQSARLVTAFRDSPEVARRLCLLLGTSRSLGQTLERQPELIVTISDDLALPPRSRDELLGRARAALSWRESENERGSALQRLARSEGVLIIARDVLDLEETPSTGHSLTALAEAVLEAAVEAVASPVPLAVVAMGRLGGAELSYASDLDLMFVHGGETPADHEVAVEAAEAVVRLVNGATPAQRVFMVDTHLRPEGKQGPVARSVDAYRTYYAKWAQTWERQALLRARIVAGDAHLGDRFTEVVDDFLWGTPLTAEEAREIRRVKARVETERIPAGEDPQFHLKLGKGSLSDVEWTAQLLQLQHQVPAQGTVAAVRLLTAEGHISPPDATVLIDAYRFLERTRNRLFLVKGAAAESLPTQTELLAKLARSLDTTPAGLREEYRRVTRKARDVFERRFYGQASYR